MRTVTVVLLEGDVVAHRQRARIEVRCRVAAAAGQVGMLGRDDRELVHVAGTKRQVVGGEEVLEPAAVIAELDRGARQHLALDRGAELPVGGAHAPAVEDLGVDGRSNRVAEVLRQPGATLAVGGRRHQRAVGNEVPIEVVPASRRRAREPRALSRVVQRVAVLVVGALQGLPDIQLDRRLVVAEHVPGGSAAIGNVVEAGDAVGARKGDRNRVERLRRAPAVAFRGCPAGGVVVAQRALQRQPPERPLVLRVERVIPGLVRRVPVPDEHRELVRHAIAEPVGELVLVALIEGLEMCQPPW